MTPTEPKDPVGYAPETVLEVEHVAAWLRVHPRTVERLDIPCVMLGEKTRRYLAKHVLDWLDKKRRAA